MPFPILSRLWKAARPSARQCRPAVPSLSMELLEERTLLSGVTTPRDDFPGRLARARFLPFTRALGLPARLSGAINTPGDQDSFRFVAPATGLATVQMTETSAGNLNSVLSVFDGSRRLMASSNNTGADNRLEFIVTAGQTYYVRASGTGEDTGAYTLDLSIRPDASVPTRAVAPPQEKAPVPFLSPGEPRFLAEEPGAIHREEDPPPSVPSPRSRLIVLDSALRSIGVGEHERPPIDTAATDRVFADELSPTDDEESVPNGDTMPPSTIESEKNTDMKAIISVPLPEDRPPSSPPEDKLPPPDDEAIPAQEASLDKALLDISFREEESDEPWLGSLAAVLCASTVAVTLHDPRRRAGVRSPSTPRQTKDLRC